MLISAFQMLITFWFSLREKPLKIVVTLSTFCPELTLTGLRFLLFYWNFSCQITKNLHPAKFHGQFSVFVCLFISDLRTALSPCTPNPFYSRVHHTLLILSLLYWLLLFLFLTLSETWVFFMELCIFLLSHLTQFHGSQCHL